MHQSKNKGFSTQRWSDIAGIFLMVIGIFYFLYIVLSFSKFLFKKFNPIMAEKIYSESQWQQSQNVSEIKILDEWAIKNKFTGWKNYMDEIKSSVLIRKQKDVLIRAVADKGVSDSFLYSYAGYKYVTGADPSLINPEHPPLAKYLIGYSILLFGSEHMVGIIIAAIVLALVGIISYQLYGSLLCAGLALFFTSIFPLFYDQIIHGPQLELYQLFFFLIVAHLFLMAQKKKKYILYAVVGIFFGLLLSTKTFLPFFLLFGAWLIILFWRQWKIASIIIGLGILTFVATYFSYFIHGGTLRSFLGLQKYIVVFYGNAHIPLLEFVGNYLRLIFTGSWKFWDSSRSVSRYSEWNILWPILFVVGIGRIKSGWKKNMSLNIIVIFFVLYNLFVLITPIFPRYLLLLFVPLIILI